MKLFTQFLTQSNTVNSFNLFGLFTLQLKINGRVPGQDGDILKDRELMSSHRLIISTAAYKHSSEKNLKTV